MSTLSANSGDSDFSAKVAASVQPVLDEMARKYNTSYQFGYVDAKGSAGLASGVMNVWNGNLLLPESPVPLGSVTKPWTAVRVLQEVEKGTLALNDPVNTRVDKVLRRLYNSTLAKLFGAESVKITIVDLLGHSTGFGDYDDQAMKQWSIEHDADDVDPFFYLLSASKSPIACAPQTCASYSGANYVLLGFVMAQLLDLYSWQEFDQLSTIPESLWTSGKYRSTTFPKLGRCMQYPGVAHSYATVAETSTNQTIIYDLGYNSCLNGWTMGNIASTGKDLAQFFFDLITLAPSNGGFVNSTTLSAMTTYHSLVNTWCAGPKGPGSCQYGLGLEHDQIGLDVWAPFIANPFEKITREHETRLTGHDGADWGSMASPCGYNSKFGFGICLVHTSSSGLNCSLPASENALAPLETMCKVYDAVLAVVGGPRFSCKIPAPAESSQPQTCVWKKIKGVPVDFKRRASSEAIKAFLPPHETTSHIMV
jgi:CubicO group peptidase (beta-lactamase class C family)